MAGITGVIGIVAARLLEAYEKPVVVTISKDDDGFAVGSARSMKGFNIFKCFESCRDILGKIRRTRMCGRTYSQV